VPDGTDLERLAASRHLLDARGETVDVEAYARLAGSSRRVLLVARTTERHEGAERCFAIGFVGAARSRK